MISDRRRDNILIGLMATCAVIMTGVRLREHFQNQAGGQTAASASFRTAHDTAPVQVPDWKTYTVLGHRQGSASAPVTILEFGDFECPACRRFELNALRPIEALYGQKVSVVFRHWPLPYHRFAGPSAVAAECAGVQGRFEALHDLLYDKQDSLGLKTFTSYAREAGVPDTTAFAACMHSGQFARTVSADSAAARRVGGTGTPTIVINGARLVLLPDSAALDGLVRAALSKTK